MFRGEDLFIKKEKLQKALLDVENKYLDYFKSRPPKYEREEHDRLHNHYLLHIDHNEITFGFSKFSRLPDEIVNDCIKCFKEIYKP